MESRVAQSKQHQQRDRKSVDTLRKTAQNAQNGGDARNRKRKIQRGCGAPADIGQRAQKRLRAERDEIVCKDAGGNRKGGIFRKPDRPVFGQGKFAHARKHEDERNGRHIHKKVCRRKQRNAQFFHLPLRKNKLPKKSPC